MTVIVRHCRRCGHDWPQRFDRKPAACPNCKRYDWNTTKPDLRRPRLSRPPKEA